MLLTVSVAVGAPKKMKEIGTIHISGSGLLTDPAIQGRKSTAVYKENKDFKISIIDSRGATISGIVENPNSQTVKEVKVVGFANYNIIMYYKMNDGAERFYSYKMSKKGLKILGSTAAEKFAGRDITNVSFDAKNVCIVSTPKPEDGVTILTQKMIQYTTKLGGMKKLIPPKYNYETTINSTIILPVLKNKYIYDIDTIYAEEDGEEILKNITVKILK
jgi:hypothetical protein